MTNPVGHRLYQHGLVLSGGDFSGLLGGYAIITKLMQNYNVLGKQVLSHSTLNLLAFLENHLHYFIFMLQSL